MSTESLLPTLLLTRELEDDDLWRHARSGRLERVRRGAYTPADASLDAIDRAVVLARLHMEAVSRQTVQPHWFSHQSAALLHELPTLVVPGVTHLIQRYRRSGGADPRIRRHYVPIAEHDRQVVAGLPATSLERTVLDCARGRNTTEAVMIIDAYLNRGGDLDALYNRLTELRGQRGVRLAAKHFDWADAGAESPGESRTRVMLRHGGLQPKTQVPVRTHLGRFWLDMGWPEHRVGVEYDGLVKYTKLADGDPADVVFREKRRQDALEEVGWSIQRVTSADLRQPDRLLTAVRGRLHRARTR